MTRGETIFTAVFVLINAFFMGVFCGRMIEEKLQPKATEVINKPTQPQPSWRKDAYMAIRWRGKGIEGITPLEVLQSTSERMQSEQATDLGSDANARAMILVMEAVAILEGRDKTVDGIKVIE